MNHRPLGCWMLHFISLKKKNHKPNIIKHKFLAFIEISCIILIKFTFHLSTHTFFIVSTNLFCFVYSEGTSTAPLFTSSMISCAGRPSTVQPTLCAVPKISLTVPLNSRAIDLGRITRAIEIISSNVILPLCLTKIKNWIINNDNFGEKKPLIITHCF